MTNFELFIYTPTETGVVNFSFRTTGFILQEYTPTTLGIVNFAFSGGVISPFFIGLGISGKLGTPTSADPLGVNGIYQMRMTKRGKVPVKMKFYTPTNPQTELQQANRAKFAAAMAAWQGLSSGDKAVYNKRAKKRQMFGWGLFIREYYQANP